MPSRRSLPARTGSVLFVLALAGFAAGCMEDDPPKPPPGPVSQACHMPRPQICNMLYQPVCGVTADGGTHTYGNACSACSHAEVTGFAPGKCAQDQTQP